MYIYISYDKLKEIVKVERGESAMYIIENQYLKVEVCKKGAELQSIFDKEMGKEILWTADAKFWARRSPILFPNVGRHHENQYLYNGL